MSFYHDLGCEKHMRIKIGEITANFYNSNIDDPEGDMSFTFLTI